MTIIGIIILIISIIFIFTIISMLLKDSIKSKGKRSNKSEGNINNKSDMNKKLNIKKTLLNKDNESEVKVLDSQDILDFEEIIVCNEENAIIQYNDNSFIGIIEAKGINFNLLSTDERIMLEESFGELLNGLDFPIQFYIQSRKIDLDSYIKKYENMLNQQKKEIQALTDKVDPNIEVINNKKNQLEYGKQLLNYFIQRTVNANLLERKYYIIVKYTHNSENYEHELNEYEILSAAYNDICNKTAFVMDALSRNNLKSKLLSPIEVSEVLYSSYNRSDSSLLKFKNLIKSKYNHLCTTSKPIELKKIELEIKKSKEKEERIMNQLGSLNKEMGEQSNETI